MLRWAGFRWSSTFTKPGQLARLQFFPSQHPSINLQNCRHTLRDIINSDGKIRPHRNEQLYTIADLLTQQKNTQAVQHLIDSLTHPAYPSSDEERSEHYQIAIRLFAHVRDFASSIEIANYAVEHGFSLDPGTYLALLEGKRFHDKRHLEQILDTLSRIATLQKDDDIFAVVLRLMNDLGHPAQAIQNAFDAHKALHGNTWQSSSFIHGELIRAYATPQDSATATTLLKSYNPPGPSNGPLSRADAKPAIILGTLLKPRLGPIVLRDEQNLELRLSSPDISTTGMKRSPYCYPLTPLLLAYSKHNKVYLKTRRLLSDAKHKCIPLDIDFYHALIKLFTELRNYSRAFGVYNIMLDRPELLLPVPFTFNSIFASLIHFVQHFPHLFLKKRYKTVPWARQVFREMVYLNSKYPSAKYQNQFLDVENLTKALAFYCYIDYAAAIVVCDILSLRHPTSFSQISTWIYKHIYHRICDSQTRRRDPNSATATATSTDLSFDTFQSFIDGIQENAPRTRDPTNPTQTMLDESLVIKEVLQRALLAELGHSVSWDRGKNDDNVENVDNADASPIMIQEENEVAKMKIAKARSEMIPQSFNRNTLKTYEPFNPPYPVPRPFRG